MSAEANAPTASDYIVHHLTHWQNKPQTEIVDFSVFNIDSLFFSVLLGVLGCFFLWKAASRATAGHITIVSAACARVAVAVHSASHSVARVGITLRHGCLRCCRVHRRRGNRSLFNSGCRHLRIRPWRGVFIVVTCQPNAGSW